MTTQVSEMIHTGDWHNDIMLVPISSVENPAYTMFEIIALPGASIPPLRHTEQDMAFYVLEGAFAFQRADSTQLLNLDEVIFVRQGITHAFTNTSAVLGRLLVITTGDNAPTHFTDALPLVYSASA